MKPDQRKSQPSDNGGLWNDLTSNDNAHSIVEHSAPFTVVGIQRCDYKSKRATATIDITGIAQIDVDYFEPTDKLPFVASRSIRNQYGGQYERTVRLAPEFAARLLAAVEAALEKAGAE